MTLFSPTFPSFLDIGCHASTVYNTRTFTRETVSWRIFYQEGHYCRAEGVNLESAADKSKLCQ